ncbi:MAG: hypothetical protein Tsb0021_05250 [Chlamydiales bacterium]
MEHFWTLLLLSGSVVLIAIFLLTIGLFLSGKVRIVRGACGMDPYKLRDRQCGTSEIFCELCKPELESKSLHKTDSIESDDEN